MGETTQRTVQSLVSDAKNKGLWLYDAQYKWWYSPEDFLHIFERNANADQGFLDRLKIMHPIEGISAGFKQMAATKAKLDNFMKRVSDYYSKP